jgi:hypothetical protein
MFDCEPFNGGSIIPADSMTLVLAARTAEGVVMVSDSLEFDRNSGATRRDQEKIFQFGRVLVGVAGSGQWLQSVEEPTWLQTTSAAELAELIRAKCIGSGLPAFECMCVANDGFAFVHAQRVDAGGNATWNPVLKTKDPWRPIGLPLAVNGFMNLFWRDGLSLLQLASMCHACVTLSESASAAIGGPTRIRALFTDPGKAWDATWAAAAEQQSAVWVAKVRGSIWV